jgi:hypothetical protein
MKIECDGFITEISRKFSRGGDEIEVYIEPQYNVGTPRIDSFRVAVGSDLARAVERSRMVTITVEFEELEG